MTWWRIFKYPYRHGHCGRLLKAVFIICVFCTWTVSAVEEINIVGLFRDRAIVELDGVRRVLVPGKATPEGAVLLSANSREAVIKIDGITNTYTLGNHISSRFTGPTGQKTVTIAPDSTGMYVVDGSINDFQVKFIIDTGASFISMNKHQANRIGIDYKMDGKKQTASTASGTDKIYVVKLNKVTVGDIVLTDVQGAVHDGDYPRQVLLGSTFLNRVGMKRDGRLLKLEK